MRHFALLLCLFANLLVPSRAADWPCWRGPDGLGVSREKDLPVTWDQAKHIAWRPRLVSYRRSLPSPIFRFAMCARA